MRRITPARRRRLIRPTLTVPLFSPDQGAVAGARCFAISRETVPNYAKAREITRTKDTPTPHTAVADYVRQQTDAKDPADYALFGLGKCGFTPSPRS